MNIAWFRRDLRLHDNPMLAAATNRGEPTVGLFVLDPRLTEGRRSSPNRNACLRTALVALRHALRDRGTELFIREGDPETTVPAFAADCGATSVQASRDYTDFARRRDEAVRAALARQSVRLVSHPGVLVAEPEDIRRADGAPFRVFTPFWRRWKAAALRPGYTAPTQIAGGAGDLDPGRLPTAADRRFVPTATILPSGEPAARERMEHWLTSGLETYTSQRDMLATDGTSRLSQDLHFGTISPRELVERASIAGRDAETFVSELAWRDFFHHLVWHVPRVVREPFQERYAGVSWEDDPAGLAAWTRGETGYPIIDAAMRELHATGFMHNRARMITASFLTKDLLIDWRLGEAHFLQHLADGDVAINNGGWQWAASTGADAMPYFRVFNPTRQGERFDPEGTYVRRWIEPLHDVPARYVHEPWRMDAATQQAARCVIGRDYPAPIVEHAMARARAIERFRELRDSRVH